MKRAAILAACLALATPASATPPDNDFLVVVGSYSLRLRSEATANLARVEMAASRCGYTLRHTSSSRLEGPRPLPRGRIVHYTGPFSEHVAGMVLARIRRCVPDAFIYEVYSPFGD